MSQPNQSDLIDPVLTDLAIAYSQDQGNFISDKVAPMVNVNDQAGQYYTIPKGNFFADQAKRRGPGAESAGSGYDLGSGTYLCDVWALHKNVSNQMKAQASSPFDWNATAMRFVMDGLLIRREALFAEKAMGTSIWGTDATPGTTWDDASSTPMSDIETGKETVMLATGREPNTLVLDFRVFNRLRRHPEIRARLGTASDRPLDADQMDIARIFGVEKVHVMKSIKNSANEGATFSGASISGKHALLCYTAQSPSMDTPSALYTFNWANLNGAGLGGINIKSFDIPQNSVTRVEGEMALDIKVTASDLGYFFNGAVA